MSEQKMPQLDFVMFFDIVFLFNLFLIIYFLLLFIFVLPGFLSLLKCDRWFNIKKLLIVKFKTCEFSNFFSYKIYCK